MEKFIPYEKLAKKEQQKINKAKRGTWGAMDPVPRKPRNSKAYNRKRAQAWKKDVPDLRSFSAMTHDSCVSTYLRDYDTITVDFECTKKDNMGKPWTPEHDSCLQELYDKGVPIDTIAITLKRNSGAICARLKKLGLDQ